jgi:DnaJ like chaperone protein
MSIWSRIAAFISTLPSGETLLAWLGRQPVPPERTVAFTIGVIALGAKIAKADGRVTRNEVAAFREVFHIPPEEEANAARVYDLARQDIAGFRDYASRIARLFGEDRSPLTDLLEGLIHIALADGRFHENEDGFLSDVAAAFGLSAQDYARLKAIHVPGTEPDPFAVLGVTPDTPPDQVRAAWRALVRDTHPDVMAARGLPAEAVKLAEKRLVAINAAWDQIGRGHA